MDLSTAKYIMDYIYFNRANETAFKYYKKVSLLFFSLSLCVSVSFTPPLSVQYYVYCVLLQSQSQSQTISRRIPDL